MTTPAHCVWCGYEMDDLPRPEQCPECGERWPWGSAYADYPDKAEALKRRAAYGKRLDAD